MNVLKCNSVKTEKQETCVLSPGLVLTTITRNNMISSINQITLNEPFCFSWAFVLSILTGTGRYKSVGHGVPAFLPLRMWKTNEIINTRDQKWTFSKVLKEEILCSFLMVSGQITCYISTTLGLYHLWESCLQQFQRKWWVNDTARVTSVRAPCTYRKDRAVCVSKPWLQQTSGRWWNENITAGMTELCYYSSGQGPFTFPTYLPLAWSNISQRHGLYQYSDTDTSGDSLEYFQQPWLCNCE